MEKKFESNYTRMLGSILNKNWKQNATKPQLYDHLPPIPKTIQLDKPNMGDTATEVHVMLLAWISQTLSSNPCLSSIAPRGSLRLHPLSAQSCCILVLADRLAFACPCDRVHRTMSLICSSLLLRQCLECLVHLTWIGFVYAWKVVESCCFVECLLQDFLNIARSILV